MKKKKNEHVTCGEYQIANWILKAHVGPADPTVHARVIADYLANCGLAREPGTQHVLFDGQAVDVVWHEEFWWVG